MSSINSVNGASALQKLSAPVRKPAAAETAAPAKSDRLELSGSVQGYLKVLQSNDIRADKVADIKARIEAGTYETDDKLNIAADRLLDELAR